VSLHAAYRKAHTVEEAPLQGDLMLFEPSTSKFFVLNTTMAFVWNSLDGAARVADVVRSMHSAFEGVEASVAEADVNHAIEELLSLGLIEPAATA
jgi:hypothetical protein